MAWKSQNILPTFHSWLEILFVLGRIMLRKTTNNYKQRDRKFPITQRNVTTFRSQNPFILYSKKVKGNSFFSHFETLHRKQQWTEKLLNGSQKKKSTDNDRHDVMILNCLSMTKSSVTPAVDWWNVLHFWMNSESGSPKYLDCRTGPFSAIRFEHFLRIFDAQYSSYLMMVSDPLRVLHFSCYLLVFVSRHARGLWQLSPTLWPGRYTCLNSLFT